MDLKNRWQVIWKSYGLFPLLMSGIAYGLILSSISQVIYFFQGTIKLIELIQQFVTSTLTYTSIFLLVIILVMVSSSIKTYLSLGMDRLSVVKIWSDVVIFVSCFVAISGIILILIWTRGDTELIPARVFNMQIPIASFLDYGKLLGLFFAIAASIAMIFTLIGNVGNKYGSLICASLCIFVVEGIIISIPVFVNLIIWGDYFAIVLVGLLLFDSLMYGVNRKMILKTEVLR